MWLAHFVKHRGRTVFRRNFKLTADMIAHKLSEKLIAFVFEHIIISDSGANKNFFNIRKLSDFTQKFKIITVIGNKSRTGLRSKALLPLAKTGFKLFFTRWKTKIGCRPSYIMDISLEIRKFSELFSLVKNRFMASACYKTPLVKGNGAKIAGAKTAAVMRD